MGFWDGVGKIAMAGLEKAKETGAEANEKYYNFERLSDEALKSKARSGNMTDRAAACKLLRERGYDPQD